MLLKAKQDNIDQFALDTAEVELHALRIAMAADLNLSEVLPRLYLEVGKKNRRLRNVLLSRAINPGQPHNVLEKQLEIDEVFLPWKSYVGLLQSCIFNRGLFSEVALLPLLENFAGVLRASFANKSNPTVNPLIFFALNPMDDIASCFRHRAHITIGFW